MKRTALALLVLSMPVAPSGAAAGDWTTYGGNAAHMNSNQHERALSRRRVAKLRMTWKVALNAVIDTQPTYASNVEMGGRRRRNLVFAATEHGGVFAVDARSGQIVWRRHLRQQQTQCFANTPDERFGVSATPIIERARGRLYVVAADNAVHALALSSGKEARGWPLSLGLPTASQHVWGSPTLVGHRLYVPFASYCDLGSYRGGVMLVDVRRPRVTRRWFAVKSGSQGGAIWAWGGAPVDVADGNVYVATGNALGSREDIDYAEHVVRLSPNLAVLAADDPDVGGRIDSDYASAPMLFHPHGCARLLAVIHKRGTVFVYRRHGIAGGPIQRVQVGDPAGLETSGTFAWSPTHQTLYVTNETPHFHGILGLRVSGCRLEEAWRLDLHREMWTPSSPTVANGVVYFGTGRDGEVLAVDAETGRALWRSHNHIRGAVYAAPTVIDGHLFAVSWDHHLYRFDARR